MPTINPPVPATPAVVTDAEAVATVVRHVRTSDVTAAVRYLGAIDERDRRTRLARAVATTLAADAPHLAAAFAVSLPAGHAQSVALEAAAQAWLQQNPEAALRWAHGLSELTGGEARRAVAEELVKLDPRAAIDRSDALPPGRGRDELLLALASAWARRDGDAAVAWARGLPANDFNQRLTAAVVFQVAQRRPDRAVGLADLLTPGRNRWLLFSAIAQTWVAIDSKAAVAWANQLPAGDARSAALAGVDTGMGIPSARRSGRAPGTRGGASRTRGSAAVVTTMAEVSSPEFAAWLATQRPGLSQEEAILEYVRQRGPVQPEAVGQWILTLPVGGGRERALDLFVQELSRSSPSDAARWLQVLPRTDRSDAMIERTAREWLRSNPDAAEAWLRGSMLPEFRKEQLLREAGR